MRKELVIDVGPEEIVIALLEDKQLVELNKEKSDIRFSVGDIYLGEVKKNLSGLNAAFVNVGFEKDAFLHYLDLGHQFNSLNKYLNLALSQIHQLPSLNKFIREPDIAKNGKISSVLSVGQYIVVQIAKEPISTKGPRLSSEISIAGRNLVLIPFGEKVSISQKIKLTEEKDRLKRLIKSIIPDNYGVIVRTVAENKKVADLDLELRYLIEKWENGFKKLKKAVPPKLIIGELNRTSTILRDILSSSFNNVYVNDHSIYLEIKDYIKTIAPEKEKIVKFYNGRINIFEQFAIDKQIKSLFGNTISLSKGAYIIIEHTEALHAIDVNSGNRQQSDNNQEKNILEVNLAAAEEIARQLRLRDMGGIIVIDFIDLHNQNYRQMVYDKMRDMMSSDRAKHNILPISRFGLMEITRQRVRPETSIKTVETCPSCKGTGEIAPSILFVDELENNIKYFCDKLNKTALTLKVHPYIAAFLNQGLLSIKTKWRLKYKRRIIIQTDNSYSFLEFHFFDKNNKKL